MEILLETDFVLVLIKLCVAHLISDYFLQFSSWVYDKDINKIKAPKLYAHIAVTYFAAAILTGEWAIALFIGITHGLIDIAKIYLGRKDALSFIIDQMLHFIVLIISSLWISDAWNIVQHFSMSVLHNDLKIWAILLGYLLVSFPMSVVIGILTHKWRQEINETYENLETLNEAGKWIGIMERLLILTFILVNQFTAIGFLIAAKAVLRIRDTERKLSEYVLIGTLLSITITVFIGIVIKLLF